MSQLVPFIPCFWSSFIVQIGFCFMSHSHYSDLTRRQPAREPGGECLACRGQPRRHCERGHGSGNKGRNPAPSPARPLFSRLSLPHHFISQLVLILPDLCCKTTYRSFLHFTLLEILLLARANYHDICTVTR